MTDRDLVRLYWPAQLRPAFDALLALDDVMAEVVASSTQPALGAIRLAWWREALERLDRHPPPAEPRLRAAAALLLSLGVTGQALAGLEEGYAALLEEVLDVERTGRSGEVLFAIGATLLGGDDPLLPLAGRLHAFARAMRLGIAAFPDDLNVAALNGYRFPRALRPLTALAKLAERDLRQTAGLEPEATPARAAALLAHRLFGTIS